MRNHFMAALIVLALAVGCKAQPAAPTPQDLELNRRIQVLIRSQFNVPADIELTLGERTPSPFPGYLALPVTLSHANKKTVIDFLLSTDGTTLARLETFSIAKDRSFSIDTTGRPVRGNPQAKVTVINFDDLQCPFCARMHETLFPPTIDRYQDKVKFIYKDNPLIELHPWAMHAAVDANCLAAQDGNAYWAYVDYLHRHTQEVDNRDGNLTKIFANLDRIARQQGSLAKVDAAPLEACLAKQDNSQVMTSVKEAEALGLDGAPALFINGERFIGAQAQPLLWKVIDRALLAAGVEPPPPDAPTPALPKGK